MKIKVSEATPPQLDWLVAKCEGIEVAVWPDSIIAREPVQFFDILEGDHCEFSTSWSQGGPIIEREAITIKIGDWNTDEDVTLAAIGNWCARTGIDEMLDSETWQYGPTALVAAMRCYVASKLGDEVEVPEEL